MIADADKFKGKRRYCREKKKLGRIDMMCDKEGEVCSGAIVSVQKQRY